MLTAEAPATAPAKKRGTGSRSLVCVCVHSRVINTGSALSKDISQEDGDDGPEIGSSVCQKVTKLAKEIKRSAILKKDGE